MDLFRCTFQHNMGFIPWMRPVKTALELFKPCSLIYSLPNTGRTKQYMRLNFLSEKIFMIRFYSASGLINLATNMVSALLV